MAQITSRLEELGQLRIVDLKKLLLDNGLPTNGNKADLIDHLLAFEKKVNRYLN